MSRRFALSTPASQDLEEIIAYLLEHGGEQAALRVAVNLEEAFKKLADSPGLGHRRDDLTTSPVLFYSVFSYLIIFKPDTRPLEIARVVHGARDVETLLREEPL